MEDLCSDCDSVGIRTSEVVQGIQRMEGTQGWENNEKYIKKIWESLD